MTDAEIISKLNSRLEALRTERSSWFSHWNELASFILPRRYEWLVTPNQASRGAPLNSAILDSTGTIAARTCAAGMMSGITSPSRPWFRLGIAGLSAEDLSADASLWLDSVERILYRVFSESNFYQSIGICYFDLTVFGTASLLIYEDYENVIRCENPALGEFFVGRARNTFYREFTLNTSQLVETFGLEACPQEIRDAYKAGRAQLFNEYKVSHGIEPNNGLAPRNFPYQEVYWLAAKQHILRRRGFNERPAFTPRWDLTANDAYGRSPAMDALGDIKQLQQEQRRKAQGIDKLVNPPMIADIQLKNQPASLLPGGVTYIAGLSQQPGAGFRPAYQINPPIQEMMLDIQQIQQRIQSVFFNDLFMMISSLQTVRSATEVDARREEKLIMLGPVLERLNVELLDPVVERVFGICRRAGIVPPPPPEIQGEEIEISYTSMLAQAQRATATSSIERVLQIAGNLVGVKPDVLDNIDTDVMIAEYAELLDTTPRMIRKKEDVMAMRQGRERAAQQEAILQQTLGASNAAKNLAQADLGGGQNALQAMLGGLS